MRFSSKGWLASFAALAVLAGWFWLQGDRNPSTNPATPVDSKSAAASAEPSIIHAAGATTSGVRKTNQDVRFPWRLSNTPEASSNLFRKPTALLLENALIDTAIGSKLEIPQPYRQIGPAKSYIVQAKGLTDETFRQDLKDAGATVVSYIPNNAYLVRGSDELPNQLANKPRIASVVVYEPYFKVQPNLFEPEALAPADDGLARLSVTLFPEFKDKAMPLLTKAGVRVIQQQPSPFGWRVLVEARAFDLPQLAGMDAVQSIESAPERRMMNDLTRERLTVSSNTVATNNWLGLTGSNILVSVSDSGIDASHPDLIGRVTGETTNLLLDVVGHGTHVAGIIASSGLNSPPGTNIQGSVDGANFRGMAPAAKLHAIGVDLITGPEISDTYLQTAVVLTNALVSNNSWAYGIAAYNDAAASYDAAVRDAIPELSGEQWELLVFAAGNSGGGTDNGAFGIPGTILSPATAKNVISVGALEQYRNITNEAVSAGQTNAIYALRTDSSDEVAEFSSRGNVGIGLEGVYGRFKPDVVAPGEFVVSTKSSNYVRQTGEFQSRITSVTDQTVQPGQTNFYSIPLDSTVIGLFVQLLPNQDSPPIFPALPIVAGASVTPSVVRGTNLARLFPPALVNGVAYYGIVNPGNQPVALDIRLIAVTRSDTPSEDNVRADLDAAAAPYYRFESGTSMAAPAVSGVLALMHEFFTQQLPAGLRRTNSPALMKALLINGARSASAVYDFRVQNSLNHQGWGVPRITNAVREVMLSAPEASWPVRLFDQSPTNALVTGQSFVRQMTVSPDAYAEPLRFTLVWTDPPGNPRAGVKLVNDLDLVVTNLDTGEIFYGNNFAAGSDFTSATTVSNAPFSDSINNVEQVIIPPPLGTNYAVAVIGRRVNVNAISAQTNGVAQDFALIVSADAGGTAPFTLATPVQSFDPQASIIVVTNGVPISGVRVGASSSLLPAPSRGTTNQWRFFVFTNSASIGGSNVIFATFFPPNISRDRVSGEGDLDLYVSTNPSLTNLDATVLASAYQSRLRGGTETVQLINAPVDTTYFVAVKSEDQMGVEFGLFTYASNEPFSERDADGNVVLRPLGIVPGPIPDGSLGAPGVSRILFMDATIQERIQRVLLTNDFNHQLFGDLFNEIQSRDANGSPVFATLNNHSSRFKDAPGFRRIVYDDSDTGDILLAAPVDGPGSLLTFSALPGSSRFDMVLVDNSLNHTGSLQYARLKLFLQQTNSDSVTVTVLPNRWVRDFVDIVPEVDRLDVVVTYPGPASTQGPIDTYLRYAENPTQALYDKKQTMIPSLGGTLSLSRFDSPPLRVGTYFAGFFNPNSYPVTITYRFVRTLSVVANQISQASRTNSSIVVDDAVSRSLLNVTNTGRIAAIQLQMNLSHPRVSDLSVSLISPQGTRALAMENRGGTDPLGFYGVLMDTNYLPTLLGLVPTLKSVTNTVIVTNILLSTGFENMPVKNYTNGFVIPATPGSLIIETGSVDVAGLGFGLTGPSFEGTNALDLIGATGEQGRVAAFVQTKPGTNYTVTFQYSRSPDLTNTPATARFTNSGAPAVVFSSSTTNWASFRYDFFASNTVTAIRLESIATAGASGMLIDALDIRSIVTNITIRTDLVYPTDTNTSVVPIKFAVPPLTNGYFFSGRALVVTNGFESTNPVPAVPVSVPAGTNLGPWQVVAGDVDLFTSLLFDNGVGPDLGFAQPYSGDRFIDLNGTNAGTILTNVSLRNGGKYRASFAYARHPESIRLSNSPPRMQLSSGPDVLLTLTLPALSSSITNRNPVAWNTTSVVFTATTSSTNLTFAALTATATNGVLLDAVSLEELPSNPDRVFLAEETFSAFVDQLAVGNWMLEVRDTRVGGVPAVINDWSLRFIYQPTDAGAIVLTNNSRMTNVVRGSEIRYFAVETPYVAAFATNTLFNLTGNGGLNLFFNQNGVPNGGLAGDVQLMNNVLTSSQYVLTTNGAPPIFIPGQRYYLGVQNVDVTKTNDFAIHIQFDRIPTNSSIVPILTNGFALATNLPPGAVINYYAVDISTNAIAAAFEVINPSGDVDLVLRSDLPLPNPVNYDYISANPGTNNEYLVITTNTYPRPLKSGTWYLGVYNLTSSDVTYRVRVTEEYAFAVTNVVDLVLNTPLATSKSAGSVVTNFYRLRLPDTNSAILFEILNPVGDVDLVMRRDALPSMASYDSISRLSTNYSDQIVVRTNLVVTDLVGDWYLAVPNNEFTNVAFSIRASVATNGILQSANPATTNVLSDGVPLTLTVGPSILVTNYFQFTVTNSNAALYFEVYDMNGDVDLTIGKGGIPSAVLNQLSARPGTATEFVLFRTNAAVVAETVIFPDLNGSWLLAIPNYDVNPVTFTVRATTSNPVGIVVPGAPTIITPQIDLGAGTYSLNWNSIPGEHYRIDTSTDLVNWTLGVVPPGVITAPGSSASVILNLAAPLEPSFFYRIVQIP